MALFLLNEKLNIKGKVQWACEKMVTMKIKERLWGVGDAKMRIFSLWGYFKTFQAVMKRRERIPKEVVEKYEQTICFMIDKDQC